MIIVSEIGDKTFLVAALMAMRHPPGLGHILPTLISRAVHNLCSILPVSDIWFQMLHEGLTMEGGTGRVEEEIREVEDEIKEKEQQMLDNDGQSAGYALEEGLDPRAGTGRPSSNRQLTGIKSSSNSNRTQARRSSQVQGLKNLTFLLISPVLIQTFIMTFLAEWGDRSQISTIAMAAAHNVYLVTIGTVLGHAMCTFLAVMGGRWLATKISVKHVTLGGAILFLIFGVLYLYEAYTWIETDLRPSPSQSSS
ncbi:hypothetical protein PPACK8108_LOCUS24746 [Phakopsora pachyrhizi]|uniref:GDT1 family protein n=1 Tax=Phakopsora pachyrhizi TaxID=170000 RepID=A0AAV0BTQ9_PHAPC|nr:hypothetical protein PPACK8108_LOCUS24746 [Phakopsora pachyrhizi]